ncbi:hypothetical protein SAMN05660865_01646 [Caloramator fervidus]|uniref:Uncharacterized protein n=1 Tax=Caloramator fervidus TaxID=29344 RepID=A0A1H5X2P0_9CLOT|nr:CBO2463/CBO2479 domain-containing protein [Caloramator fervidus]SEG06018.1 hypothetical protein SAMN05660865_01646 [Caloramator fervidus]
MKYGDKIIEMQGIITEVQDGAVAIDLKGRLGYIKIPLRMLITDYPLKVGQEVAFKMSFIEVINEEPNLKYVKNIERKEGRQE